jgi:hypothetical protein
VAAVKPDRGLTIGATEARKICSSNNGPREVRVRAIDASVDNRDARPLTAGNAPGLLDPVILQPVLTLSDLVGNSGSCGPRTRGEHKTHKNGGAYPPRDASIQQ